MTIMRLLKEHRHFLKLFGQTDSAQRKALLRTITAGQIKALSEIAHNIIKFRIVLTPSEKVLLRRSRRQLYILGDRTLGYQRKVEALGGKQKFIRTLLKITLAHLKSELNNGKASPSPLREVPEAIGWQNNGEENAEPTQKT